MNGATTPLKKYWRVGALKGGEVKLMPSFQVNGEDGNVEARYVEMRVGEKEYMFNYLDLFMFFYFTANEELRRTLSLRQEATKKVSFIPYEVSFKLDDKECKEHFAKRRIEVPIDALTMAVARQEALKFMKFKRYFGGKRSA